MPTISDHEKATATNTLDDGLYLGRITEATVLSEIVNGARVDKLNKFGKSQLEITVELDDLEDDDGAPIKLRRRFAISYGTNQTTGQPSELVRFICAVTGLKAMNLGAVRSVKTEELSGKAVHIQTTTVEKDGRIYTNIASFLPLPKPAMVQAAPRLQTEAPVQARNVPEAVRRAQQIADEEALDPNEMPF